ncbi:TOBE domain-containing protein [Brevibacterium paucivorans]|uniref:MerR family transcriptional regulator n=1 Tax=Brevibacterium paucivorans TaxID=170994 RepID=A0A2N6VL39_9MICO|nr:TOBE domain-containing protein [Brevibacterium paucivorans]PMD04855.1 MerR family transcriptional regulator [Brevibacterium paucivorans]
MTDTPMYRVSEAARFLGVSTDTVRRWIAAKTLTHHSDSSGRTVVDGVELARHARKITVLPEDPRHMSTSVANRFYGIVTDVRRGDVMSMVEIQAGPHRIFSLVGTDEIDRMQLTPGNAVIASALSQAIALERI